MWSMPYFLLNMDGMLSTALRSFAICLCSSVPRDSCRLALSAVCAEMLTKDPLFRCRLRIFGGIVRTIRYYLFLLSRVFLCGDGRLHEIGVAHDVPVMVNDSVTVIAVKVVSQRGDYAVLSNQAGIQKERVTVDGIYYSRPRKPCRMRIFRKIPAWQ